MEPVSHAILEIEDYDKIKTSSSAKKSSPTPLNEKTSYVLEDINRRKSNILNGIANNLNTMMALGASNVPSAVDDRISANGAINVQYNPSSIKFSGSMSRSSSEKEEEDGAKIITVTNTGKLRMSFDLVFNAKDNDDTSVQDQMQLIMRMLQLSPTKMVVFSWGKISMRGKVVSFSGSYDIFNDAGVPMGGKMSLSIQTDVTSKDVSKMAKEMGKERNDKIEENAVKKT